MKPKLRIRLRPAVTARVMFFLVLYLVGLSVLPALTKTHRALAMAWDQSSASSSFCCDSHAFRHSPVHRILRD